MRVDEGVYLFTVWARSQSLPVRNPEIQSETYKHGLAQTQRSCHAIEGCAFSLSDATDCHRARRLNLQQPVGQNRAGPQTNMISLLFGAIGSLLRWCDIPALWLFIIRIYVRFNPPANTYKCVWRGASRRLNRVVVQAPDPSVQSLWSADDSSRDPPPSFSCTPRHVQLCREKLWTRL